MGATNMYLFFDFTAEQILNQISRKVYEINHVLLMTKLSRNKLFLLPILFFLIMRKNLVSFLTLHEI